MTGTEAVFYAIALFVACVGVCCVVIVLDAVRR
jgi:hypothetical protein